MIGNMDPLGELQAIRQELEKEKKARLEAQQKAEALADELHVLRSHHAGTAPEHVQHFMHMVPSIVYIYDLEQDKSIYLNSCIQKILGFTEDDLNAMNGHSFMSVVQEEDKPLLLRHTSGMLDAQDGEVREITYSVLAKDASSRVLFCREAVFKRNAAGK